MSVDRMDVTATDTTWLPVSATGTKDLPRLLPAGRYSVITDTTQSLTNVQFLLESASTATTFGAVVRGGRGLVNTTEDCDQVTLTAGTFPLLLGLRRVG